MSDKNESQNKIEKTRISQSATPPMKADLQTQRPIVVMKFGGSSLASSEGRAHAIEHIRNELNANSSVVVVVSAMGRAGDPYATDTLLSLVDPENTDAHALDILMSAGEAISAVVLCAELKTEDIQACALTGADAGIVSSSTDGNAVIKNIDVAAVKKCLADGQVAVVTGFQATDESGILRTLGRGGSDTSACALAVALQAKRVDIYTDVDGVFTADPRLIKEATALKSISADELFQMAKLGSRIVHTPAAELALLSGVDMRVRNTFNNSDGTEVVSMDEYRTDKVATAITTVDNITRLRVRLTYAKDSPNIHMDEQTKVYALMANSGISIDMFTPMNDRLVFTVSSDVAAQAAQMLAGEGFDVALRPGLGKVSVVGSGMHGVPGVMSKVANCLHTENIDILQIADSHATISLLVDESQLVNAAKALHKAFEL